jgi:hypothetical protein
MATDLFVLELSGARASETQTQNKYCSPETVTPSQKIFGESEQSLKLPYVDQHSFNPRRSSCASTTVHQGQNFTLCGDHRQAKDE